MVTLQFLLHQIDDPNNLHAVRTAIVALIRQQLDRSRHSLGAWEKVHLTNAISALALNTEAVQQPTNAWLRLCLSDLGMVLTPPEEHDERRLDRAIIEEGVTYEKLLLALESVAQKIDRQRLE